MHNLTCRIAPFQSRVPTAQWTSDPFVEAQLMLPSEPGDDAAAASSSAGGAYAGPPLRAWGAKARTPVRPADCAPVWDSELRLPLPNSPACSAALASGRVALRLRLFDLDLVAAKNDFLGEVTIRLPPARPACAAESRRFDPRTSHVEHLIADGVFAIAEGGSAARKKGIGRLLAAAGRTPVASPEASQAASPAASPPASPPRSPRASSPAQTPPPPLPAGSLGALRVRVSWGAGVACATPQHAAAAAAANEGWGGDDSPGAGARSSASRVDLAGLKPALRPVLGVLTLTPLSISGAPAELLHSGSRVFASATIEHQDGCTRASERAAAAQPPVRGCDAAWGGRGGGGGGGALVFSVTDVTSEAVVTVLCCGADGGGSGDGIGAPPPHNHHCCALGEIVLPVAALLGLGGGGWGDGVGVWRPTELAAEQQSVFAPAGRVFRAALLPAPGAKHRRATPADGRAPLGVFAFSAHLALVRPPSFPLHPSRPLLPPLLCLAPRPLPRCRRPLAPRSPDKGGAEAPARAAAAASSSLSAASVSSAAGLRIVGGRTTDALLAPLLAPLRTLLYLQSWACPPLTAAVVAWWVVGCVAFPRCVRHDGTPATAAEQALRVLTVPSLLPSSMLWLTPLWLCLVPSFNGGVAALINGTIAPPPTFGSILRSLGVVRRRAPAAAVSGPAEKGAGGAPLTVLPQPPQQGQPPPEEAPHTPRHHRGILAPIAHAAAAMNACLRPHGDDVDAQAAEGALQACDEASADVATTGDAPSAAATPSASPPPQRPPSKVAAAFQRRRAHARTVVGGVLARLPGASSLAQSRAGRAARGAASAAGGAASTLNVYSAVMGRITAVHGACETVADAAGACRVPQPSRCTDTACRRVVPQSAPSPSSAGTSRPCRSPLCASPSPPASPPRCRRSRSWRCSTRSASARGTRSPPPARPSCRVARG